MRLYHKDESTLNQGSCDDSTALVTDRAAVWADGAYSCTFYNNVIPPTARGWTACSTRARPARPPTAGTGGVNMLPGDGSVRFVRDSVRLATWQALGSRNGGEPAGDF